VAKIVWNPGPLLSDIKTKAAQKMYQTVTVLVNESRRLVPVRTGYLKGSLTAEVTADGRTGFYGSFRPWAGENPVEYAIYVELGLGPGHRTPKPYLRPPLETKREEIKRIWSG